MGQLVGNIKKECSKVLKSERVLGYDVDTRGYREAPEDLGKLEMCNG
jgi:hypothetical protein